METELIVRQATSADRDAVVEAFGAAWLDEAGTAWVLEGNPVEIFLAEHAPAMIDRALHDDEVWIAAAGAEIWAVSIWQTVISADRVLAEAAEAQALADAAPDVRPFQRLTTLTALLAREHPREFPHRYLQVIATVPQRRGSGAGGAILADRLKAASDAGVPAFLEASTERSARLYTRRGFVRDNMTHTLPDGGPTLIPMWFRG
ncbi:GNAT family N-acetyltransferase [Nocardia sp. GCM10030253]|uniref:GNAT family N-acetyltransferase n=1 Tax=Nocardia sp. GCM10030253 TaxID=3273404 RepID=UPI003639AF80